MKIKFLTFTNSRLAGGLYNSVRNLAKATSNISNNDVAIVSYNDKFSAEDLHAYGDTKMEYYKIIGPSSFAMTFDLYSKLRNAQPDVIHLQGIWRFSSLVLLWYKKHHKATVSIIAPRGMLDPWAVKNSQWKKKIVNFLFENKNLKSADCIHALCKSEYESIRKFGIKTPVAIIPNGINLPINPVFDRDGDKKVLLFIGRIHPKKGLRELIGALAILKRNTPKFFETWTVRIAGWDQNGHINELQKQATENDLQDDINFVGPVYNKDKELELCRASAFILPSFSEGLPMSILEAWSYSLPVIMTEYCNIQEGFASASAIKIEPNLEDIYEKLIELYNLDEVDLMEMGKNGYSLVKTQFTWDSIAVKTTALYNYLLNADVKKPDFVYEE